MQNCSQIPGKPELSTGDVASELGLSQPTVRALVQSGQLSAWRFGRVLRFSREAVESFKRAQEVRPQAA